MNINEIDGRPWERLGLDGDRCIKRDTPTISMSLAWTRAGGSPYGGGRRPGGPCKVSFNALWAMLTWEPLTKMKDD